MCVYQMLFRFGQALVVGAELLEFEDLKNKMVEINEL